MMIASIHEAVGGLIGVAVARKYCRQSLIVRAGLAFVLAVVSHYCLDAIQHTEYDFFFPKGYESLVEPWLIIFETLLVSGWLWRFSQSRLIAFAGMFGGALPDIRMISIFGYHGQMVHQIFGILETLHRYFHAANHHPAWYIGFLPQLLILIFSLWAIRQYGQTLDNS